MYEALFYFLNGGEKMMKLEIPPRTQPPVQDERPKPAPRLRTIYALPLVRVCLVVEEEQKVETQRNEEERRKAEAREARSRKPYSHD
jgi:hypothetical protein